MIERERQRDREREREKKERKKERKKITKEKKKETKKRKKKRKKSYLDFKLFGPRANFFNPHSSRGYQFNQMFRLSLLP